MVGPVPSIGSTMCQYMYNFPVHVRSPVKYLHPGIVQPPGGSTPRKTSNSGRTVLKQWALVSNGDHK